ncbi:MAG: FG-GAP repeat domain-containing protein [Planctomycetota bacterium]|jgi:hypothetical protein
MLCTRQFMIVAAVTVVSLPARSAVDPAPTGAARTPDDPMPYLGAGGNGCTHPLFANPYPAGNEPYSVASGDLDGINGPDLAVASYHSDDVSVLLNRGNGSFVPAVAYPDLDGAHAVAIGDLDGANGPDLAVANIESDDVSVLLNLGDGTFAAPVAYPAGNNPWSVAIGDLDGERGPDLAVANVTSDDVTVFLNRGNGMFTDAVTYAAGDGPHSVAVGDLDGANGPTILRRDRQPGRGQRSRPRRRHRRQPPRLGAAEPG